MKNTLWIIFETALGCLFTWHWLLRHDSRICLLWLTGSWSLPENNNPVKRSSNRTTTTTALPLHLLQVLLFFSTLRIPRKVLKLVPHSTYILYLGITSFRNQKAADIYYETRLSLWKWQLSSIGNKEAEGGHAGQCKRELFAVTSVTNSFSLWDPGPQQVVNCLWNQKPSSPPWGRCRVHQVGTCWHIMTQMICSLWGQEQEVALSFLLCCLVSKWVLPSTPISLTTWTIMFPGVICTELLSIAVISLV